MIRALSLTFQALAFLAYMASAAAPFLYFGG